MRSALPMTPPYWRGPPRPPCTAHRRSWQAAWRRAPPRPAGRRSWARARTRRAWPRRPGGRLLVQHLAPRSGEARPPRHQAVEGVERRAAEGYERHEQQQRGRPAPPRGAGRPATESASAATVSTSGWTRRATSQSRHRRDRWKAGSTTTPISRYLLVVCPLGDPLAWLGGHPVPAFLARRHAEQAGRL